jgi:predicted acyltransferase (DUF342 family)
MGTSSDSDRPARRLAGIAILLVALCGLLVWGGTVTHEDAANDVPGNDAVGVAPDAYAGERVSLDGTVVATDPVVIEAEYGISEAFTVTVRGVEGPVAVGDHLSAFGTLETGGTSETDATLVADRTIVRAPWELWYMYVVSFLGGLWVLWRTLRDWRFDTDRLAFVLRTEGERNA